MCEVAGSVEQDMFCGICFESGPFESLPCACRVQYCHSCWDRALAMSIAVRGRAECPSCRACLTVDFDPDAGRLTFKAIADNKVADNWWPRLYGKARPVQIRILQQFGADAAAAAAGDCDAQESIAIPGSTTCSKPALPIVPCVCGSPLERVSRRSRITRMLEDTEPDWRRHLNEPEDSIIERLAASCLVSCDICEDYLANFTAVWTCSNGTHTLLHPASYDVCERCFIKYTGCSDASLLRTGCAGSESDNLDTRGCCFGNRSSASTAVSKVKGCCRDAFKAIRRLRSQRRG